MSIFYFKHFHLHQSNSLLKVGTDAMIFGSSIDIDDDCKSILDIGSGTGVLALMIAQKNLQSTIDAIEIDEKSCIDASLNFKESIWSERISLIQSDVKTHIFSKQYDLIVANPPYYENAYFNDLNLKHTAKHNELKLSICDLFEIVSKNLSENGFFWVILPVYNFDKWTSFANQLELYLTKRINIYGKPDSIIRVIGRFSRKNTGIISSSITIRDAKGQYTDEYKRLTIDYHNKKL